MSRIEAAKKLLPVYIDNITFLKRKLYEQETEEYRVWWGNVNWCPRWYSILDLELEKEACFLCLSILAENYYGTK